MDGGRIAGQSEKERFLLETKVTLMLVLQVEVNKFARYVVTKPDFSQIPKLMVFFPL